MVVERPTSFPWPPVLVIFFVTIAWFGSPAGDAPLWRSTIGVCLMAAGVLADVVSAFWLFRHKTAVLPHRRATELVATGPYAYSRNPIYVGYLTILIGIAVIRPAAASLFAPIAFAIAIQKLSIEPEEKHLAARFREAWQTYATRVPRWLGPF